MMLCATVLASLLMIGGVELNPGPVDNIVQVLCSGCDRIGLNVNHGRTRWRVTLVSVGPQQVEMTSSLTKCGLWSGRTVVSPSENLLRKWG